MRVGVVAPEFPPGVGGVETYAYEFSAELARRGHEVFVFTRAIHEPREMVLGLKVLPALRQKYAFDRELTQRYTMDVWHVMNAGYAWLSLETRPVIVSVHGNDFISPYQLPMRPNLPSVPGLWRFQLQIDPLHSWVWGKVARRMMWRGLSHARHVITNSHYTKQLLVRWLPRCAPTISVGFVGVGEEYLQMQPRDRRWEETKKLVTVCRLEEPRKNVDKVLCALAQLKEYSYHYTVVGGGKLRSSLEALAHQLGIGDRVTFTDFIPKGQIPGVLTSSDLFVMPSEALANSVEGFGISYLEANACGTPVLAAKSAGAREAVSEGISGYFVLDTSIGAIAKALEQFFNGEVIFDSDKCKAFASYFTWTRVVDHALQYYH